MLVDSQTQTAYPDYIVYISDINKRVYPELIEIPMYMSGQYSRARAFNIPDIIEIIRFA